MAKQRKSFPLRISQELFDELRSWAEQEMRSVNGQIEFVLRQAVRQRRNVSHSNGGSDEPPDDKNNQRE